MTHMVKLIFEHIKKTSNFFFLYIKNCNQPLSKTQRKDEEEKEKKASVHREHNKNLSEEQKQNQVECMKN